MASQHADSIAKRRHASGFRNARVRAAHSLPLGWHHLTAVDIDQIRAIVEADLADRRASLETLESRLLAWAILVTGRPLDDLLPLTVCIVPRSTDLADERHGLIKVGGEWGWWLPAGAPKDQRSGKTRLGTRPWSASLYLPATRTIAHLVERCIAIRNRAAAGRVHVTGEALPLFTHGPALHNMVEALLAERHSVQPDRARRATTTTEALGRWLPSSITQQPGGDPVPASIITGRIDPVARTTAYYGSISNESAAQIYRRAVAPVDALAHADVPGRVLDRFLGDRLTPSDAAVRGLIDRLARQLRRHDIDLAERHRAMTDYTVALLAFALAHRGWGTMPAAHEIDAETGFCEISDKTKAGEAVPRLVWVSGIARDQLARYYAHLDHVQAHVGPAAADTIGTFRSWAGLTLFDMLGGRVEPCDVAEVMRRSVAGRGALTSNAGRHWLRAQLVDRCSTETLHAFFGHGPVDDASWDWSSSLDPVIYRADITRVLDAVLLGIGWRPLDAHGAEQVSA